MRREIDETVHRTPGSPRVGVVERELAPEATHGVPVLTGTGAIRARQVRDALNTGNFDAVTYAAGRGKRDKFSGLLSEEDQEYFVQMWQNASEAERTAFTRQMSIFFDDEHAGAGGAGLRKMSAIVDKMREAGATLAQFSDYSKSAGVRVSGGRRRATPESVPAREEAPYEITEADRERSRAAMRSMDRRMQEYFAQGEGAPAEAVAGAPAPVPTVVEVDWADGRVSGVPEERRVSYEKFIERAVAAGMRIADPMALIAQLERVAGGDATVVNMPANQNAAARRRDAQKFNDLFASLGMQLRVRETWTGERYALSLIGARPAPVEEAPAVAEEAPAAPVAAQARAAYTYEDFRLRMDRLAALVPQGYEMSDPAIFDIPVNGEEALAVYREVRDHFAELDAILSDPALEAGRRAALTNLRTWVNDALTLAGA